MTHKPTNIVLVGMPAAGKSTVGILLAKRLGLGFLDTDVTLQTETGCRLDEIIAEKGMTAFCRMEADHVCRLTVTRHVIATGGSVIYSDAAMTRLKEDGLVVHLDIPLAPLIQRIGDIKSRGVVITPGLTLEDLFRERDPLYRRHADLAIDCSKGTPDQIAEALIRQLPPSFSV